MDIALAVERLVPGAEYFGSVESNDNAAWKSVDWRDSRGKPSWGDLVSAYSDIQKEQTNTGITKVGNLKERIENLENAVLALLGGSTNV